MRNYNRIFQGSQRRFQAKVKGQRRFEAEVNSQTKILALTAVAGGSTEVFEVTTPCNMNEYAVSLV